MKIIKNIILNGLRYGNENKVRWENLTDINILKGANDSGKTDIMLAIYKRLNDENFTFYEPFQNSKGNINTLMFSELKIDSKIDYLPKLNDDRPLLSSMKMPVPGCCDGEKVAEYLNQHFFAKSDKKVFLNDKMGRLWIKDKGNIEIGINDNHYKLLYLFSFLEVFKELECVVILDCFLDSFDAPTQKKILEVLEDFIPKAQFFIVSQSYYITENRDNVTDIKDIIKEYKVINSFDKELINKKVGDSVVFVVINLKKRELENQFSGFKISKIDNMEVTATYPFPEWMIDDVKYDLSNYGQTVNKGSEEDNYVRFAVSSLNFYYENEDKYLELI